jgi:trk system potassium uptake protein TrkA
VFVIVAGGGKLGANVTKELRDFGHEVVLIERDRRRYAVLDERLGGLVHAGDASEPHVLKHAGAGRPADVLVAVTGSDQDNIVACQLAREKFRVGKVVARVNDPRNQPHFDLLGISPTVSPTSMMMAIIEHEVPQHELLRLLKLQAEGIEIVEIEIAAKAPCAGAPIAAAGLPNGARVIALLREGRALITDDATRLRAGDQVLVLVPPDLESAVRDALCAA